MGQALGLVFIPPLKIRRVIRQMHFIGARSLLVIALTGLFAGMVLGLQGYYTLLVGQNVPYHRGRAPTDAEWARWNEHRQQNRAAALKAMTVSEVFSVIRSPQWRWVHP